MVSIPVVGRFRIPRDSHVWTGTSQALAEGLAVSTLTEVAPIFLFSSVDQGKPRFWSQEHLPETRGVGRLVHEY